MTERADKLIDEALVSYRENNKMAEHFGGVIIRGCQVAEEPVPEREVVEAFKNRFLNGEPEIIEIQRALVRAFDVQPKKAPKPKKKDVVPPVGEASKAEAIPPAREDSEAPPRSLTAALKDIAEPVADRQADGTAVDTVELGAKDICIVFREDGSTELHVPDGPDDMDLGRAGELATDVIAHLGARADWEAADRCVEAKPPRFVLIREWCEHDYDDWVVDLDGLTTTEPFHVALRQAIEAALKESDHSLENPQDSFPDLGARFGDFSRGTGGFASIQVDTEKPYRVDTEVTFYYS